MEVAHGPEKIPSSLLFTSLACHHKCPLPQILLHLSYCSLLYISSSSSSGLDSSGYIHRDGCNVLASYSHFHTIPLLSFIQSSSAYHVTESIGPR